MAIFYMQNSQVTSALRDLLVPTVFTWISSITYAFINAPMERM
jgi:hypothetical protein